LDACCLHACCLHETSVGIATVLQVCAAVMAVLSFQVCFGGVAAVFPVIYQGRVRAFPPLCSGGFVAPALFWALSHLLSSA
jgi:hypothetical protein